MKDRRRTVSQRDVLRAKETKHEVTDATLVSSLSLTRARNATLFYVAQREAKLREAFFVASISSETGEHGPKAADLRWPLHAVLLLALSFPPSFSLSLARPHHRVYCLPFSFF